MMVSFVSRKISEQCKIRNGARGFQIEILF